MFEDTIKLLIMHNYKQDTINKNKFTKIGTCLDFYDMNKENELVVLLKDNHVEVYNNPNKGKPGYLNQNGIGKTFKEAFENWLELEKQCHLKYNWEQHKDIYEKMAKYIDEHEEEYFEKIKNDEHEKLIDEKELFENLDKYIKNGN